MKKLAASSLLLVIAALAAWTVHSYSVPDPSWNRTVLDGNAAGQFVETEFHDGKVHITYMDQNPGGVRHYSTKATDSLQNTLEIFFNGRKWDNSTIDTASGTGRYLAMHSTEEELFVGYQDSSVGSELVIFANYTEDGWETEEVDNAGRRGPNVGMYTSMTSYEGRPLVAYHSPRQGLIAAVKDGENWNYERISDGSGWFTSAASCGRESFLAYSGRNSRDLNVSVFDGNIWETYKLDKQAQTGTALSAGNCDYKVAYNNPSTGQIEFFNNGETRSLTTSKFSRMSLLEENGYHMSFRNYGEGVFYAYSENGSDWNLTRVGETFETGAFNDLTIDSAGNKHLVYTREDSVVHAEYNGGRISRVKQLKMSILMPIVLLVAASFLSTVFLAYRNREQLSKTFHISKYN